MLEKKLEQAAVESHEDFRVFISAEPAPTAESHIIPQGILESSIKITNEPPTGMHANLHKALNNFNQVRLHCRYSASSHAISATWLAAWRSGNGVGRINEVTLR